MTLLAILLPWLSFFVRGKILAGIICLILQITLIGWLPAAIWAVMSYSNSKTEKKLDQIQKSVSSNHAHHSKTFDSLSTQSHHFYDQKDYNSAIGVLLQMIAINPKENKTYFNLACCYSLLKSKEAFNALSNSVAKGYTNFERIKTYNALEWLRAQPEFEHFLKNGYKLYIDNNKDTKPSSEINDDVFSKIEKLGKLKEQGFITEEEFTEQKKKILI